MALSGVVPWTAQNGTTLMVLPSESTSVVAMQWTQDVQCYRIWTSSGLPLGCRRSVRLGCSWWVHSDGHTQLSPTHPTPTGHVTINQMVVTDPGVEVLLLPICAQIPYRGLEGEHCLILILCGILFCTSNLRKIPYTFSGSLSPNRSVK